MDKQLKNIKENLLGIREKLNNIEDYTRRIEDFLVMARVEIILYIIAAFVGFILGRLL